MSVEDASDGVGHRFVHVVAVHKDRKQAGDGAALGNSSSFEKAGEKSED
jgi:hypothetical protein